MKQSWWERYWEGAGWTDSRLSSRKFLLVVAFYVGVTTLTYVAALVFHVNNNTVIETGITAIASVFIAYMGVNILEKAVVAYVATKNGVPDAPVDDVPVDDTPSDETSKEGVE